MAVARDTLWASGHDETVEVNQRALIDKVLARYSGEFTVFRELLQNSDDAQATAVEIHFDTQKYLDGKSGSQVEGQSSKAPLPDLKTTVVHQWTFKNNGIVFRDEDWNRLKKIAEGNPDEEKIGAFGVGFYSLFSVTEEPFVTSGDQWMGFYWKDKKDQLFARRGQLPDSQETPSRWTTFEMVLREPAPIPVAFDFTRFLTSSITFMTHLSEVSLFFDDKRLARLKKAPGVPKGLGLPAGLRSSSSSGMMTIKDLKCTPLQIEAQVMQWVYSSGSEKTRPTSSNPKATGAGGFFSSLFTSFAGSVTPQRSSTPLPAPVKNVDPSTINETSVSLSIFSADIEVRLSKKVAAELHRSTKKNPPTKLRYELIYTAKDEYDASVKEDEQQPSTTGSIFQGLRADLDGSGTTRIFIGHATGQTTGLGGHMAARFIPTVERESIDLMDRNVAIWNKELLYVGGYLARSAYDMELNTIKSLWEGAVPNGASATAIDPELESWLRRRSLHALKFFTFHPSTPSADVSSLLETAFFACAGNNFPLISTAGVRNASDIRLPDPAFAGFLRQLPVLPDDIVAKASETIGSLQSRGMIKSISFEDVLQELRSRPLTEDETVACLKWWIGVNKEAAKFELTPRTQLLNAAVLAIGSVGSKEEKIIPLSSIRTFINNRTIASMIPLDGPLPDHLLPPSISKHFAPDDILASFPWTELTIPQWLGHICSPAVCKTNIDVDINLSATWAERVLTILARAWPSLSGPSKGEIYFQLKSMTCIPTTAGMKTPDQAYFAQANIFNDLPVVKMPSGATVKGNLERVLQALGVRKHVDLQVVFNRMIKTNEWSVADLAKYLVSVQSALSVEEWARLKMTAAFFKEENTTNRDPNQKPTRYQAQQLYEPVDVFRQLGLPVIDWGKQSKWRSSSDEAKFLFELGLLRFPPLPILINLCASTDSNIRAVALKYLLENIGTHYKDYDPSNYSDVAFIPAIKSAKPCVGTPKEVFSNLDWAAMGFSVIHPTLHLDGVSKLKVKQHPPTSVIVDLLERTPPKDEVEARLWFSILAGRISDFSSQELQRMAQLKIVPVKSDGNLRWLEPMRCYFGGDAKGKFHSKLFVFINFGQPANGFLSACGTKHEPSVEEVVQTLLEDPHRFYESAEGPTQFLAELRNIAVNHKLIKSGTITRMKKAAILLGSKRKPRTADEKGDPDDFDEDEREVQYDLRRAEEIIIADDTHAHQAFGDSFFTAPQEDILEAFYAQLGSRRLSSLVKEEYQPSAEVKQSKVAADTRALILERLPLFLHEHSHARTRVSYSWLTSTVNFVVKTYGKLTVTKSLTFGDLRLSRKQDASAVAQRTGTGPIQLWLAGNSQIDMYEVATSLNRLLFDSPKANDALLFMTILSTDLKALKRRGYNVDRILRQQKAERQAIEKAKLENTTLLSKTPSTNPGTSAPATPLTPQSTVASPIAKSPPANSSPQLPVAVDRPPPIPSRNPLKMFQRKTTATSPPAELPPSIPPVMHKSPTKDEADSHVTPLSNISSNIEMAIRACRPESGSLLRNRQEMRQVRESLNEGYCDVSGRVGDLNRVGEMGSVKIYLSQDVPEQEEFVVNHKDQLARFIHILVKLARVYDLPLTSLHVFNDMSGGLIAFNRNASIFVNLRYYLEWHDTEVAAGLLNTAYISWYFTLAHEIAHNLVQPHNSEHEFYFSAICEKHLMNLGSLLHLFAIGGTHFGDAAPRAGDGPTGLPFGDRPQWISANAVQNHNCLPFVHQPPPSLAPSVVLSRSQRSLFNKSLEIRIVSLEIEKRSRWRSGPLFVTTPHLYLIIQNGRPSWRGSPGSVVQQSSHTTLAIHRVKRSAKTTTPVPRNYVSPSSTPQPITLTMTATPVQIGGSSTPARRSKYPMGPPLPLYHPLGRLALSLPPLDPASVGLPTPIRSDDQTSHSSARARRPVTKARDVSESDDLDNPLVPPAGTSPVLDVEVKEKQSPRKRRPGGSKRRRRDDDGDPTYPAKRTRMPRGTANQHMVVDEGLRPESTAAEVTPTPEPMSDLPEEGKPDRRSTRSQCSVKRRDSSASEAGSSVSAMVTEPAKDEEMMQAEKASDTSVSRHPVDVRNDEKEEGELSEEGQPPTAS
ncbi:putative protein of unknown function (DUF3684) [Lyophyllum shimeji]|uniref:Sacsin/Nov domain-containing protein n=1 Tax=Lyophyllum shimeji TaxID=47721 RepID=A0A9P3UJR2_LYOSH|nr:putative protein of unknown function (DUF3684) [Lyophyllum shimeji]